MRNIKPFIQQTHKQYVRLFYFMCRFITTGRTFFEATKFLLQKSDVDVKKPDVDWILNRNFDYFPWEFYTNLMSRLSKTIYCESGLPPMDVILSVQQTILGFFSQINTFVTLFYCLLYLNNNHFTFEMTQKKNILCQYQINHL